MKDLISRQAAIDALDAVFPVDPMKSEYAQGIACGAALAKTYVEQLPSARTEPLTIRVNNELTKEEYEKLMHDIKDAPIVLFPSAKHEKRTEERTETHACDCVSRQAAIDALVKDCKASDEGMVNMYDIVCDLKDLPSAQTERKKGKWKITNLGAVGVFDRCSECKRVVKHKAPFYNFCPNCGADMRC